MTCSKLTVGFGTVIPVEVSRDRGGSTYKKVSLRAGEMVKLLLLLPWLQGRCLRNTYVGVFFLSLLRTCRASFRSLVYWIVSIDW